MAFPILVKRFQPAVVSVADLPSIDVIVISHDHYDHLEKETIKKFASSNTRMIVPLGVGAHLKKWGNEDTGLLTRTLPFFNFSMEEGNQAK